MPPFRPLREMHGASQMTAVLAWGVFASVWGAVTFALVGSAWWVGALAGLLVAFVIVPLVVRLSQ